MNKQYGKSSRLYFHKVDKIASGSSYKTLKLWQIHNSIFTNVSIIREIHVMKMLSGMKEWVMYLHCM